MPETMTQELTINPAEYAVRLTTTLNRLKAANACRGRYAHLVKALGGVSFGHDKPINLLTILELNGTEDCLWALCATTENCDQVARLMAADFAEALLPIFEREHPNDNRPRVAIQIARQYALGQVGAAARAAAWAAARAAAWAAAGDAARDAARAAAWAAAWAAAGAAAWAAAAAGAAARDAAWDAARAAAGDAARDAAWDAAGAAQAIIIRRYLLPDESKNPMHEQELIRRHAKALKIAAALHAHDISSNKATGFEQSQWVMAAAGAQVLPPSSETRALVIVILRTFEEAEARATKPLIVESDLEQARRRAPELSIVGI